MWSYQEQIEVHLTRRYVSCQIIRIYRLQAFFSIDLLLCIVAWNLRLCAHRFSMRPPRPAIINSKCWKQPRCTRWQSWSLCLRHKRAFSCCSDLLDLVWINENQLMKSHSLSSILVRDRLSVYLLHNTHFDHCLCQHFMFFTNPSLTLQQMSLTCSRFSRA